MNIPNTLPARRLLLLALSFCLFAGGLDPAILAAESQTPIDWNRAR
jgi:hypothetical protein